MKTPSLHFPQIKIQDEKQVDLSHLSVEKTHKKMIHPNAHDNSEDFKNLGTFHRDGRLISYFPTDQVKVTQLDPNALAAN